MADILIRICMVVCGALAILSIDTAENWRDATWQFAVASIGLITILRALGVL